MIRPMLAEYWWVWLVRGVLLLALGGLVLANPAAGLAGLLAFVAAWFLVSGVFGIVGGVQARKDHPDWWVMLLSGLCGVIFGVLTFLAPGLSALVLTLTIGAYAIVVGVTEVFSAIRLRREIRGEGWLMAAGVLAVLFGAMLLGQPFVGMVSLTLLVGAYAVVVGITLVVTAFRLRRFGKAPPLAAA